MLNLKLSEIAELCHGKLNNDEFKDIVIDVISIDTRTIKKG